MSNSTATDNEFMGGASYPAIKFSDVGSSYTGQVIDITKRAAIDPDTDQPMSWPNGDPMYVYIWRVVDSNDEIGNIWVKGNAFTALRAACKEAGVTCNADLVGAKVYLHHHALGEKKKPTHNPPKLFEAKIQLLDATKRAAFAKKWVDDTGPEAGASTTDPDDFDPFGDE